MCEREWFVCGWYVYVVYVAYCVCVLGEVYVCERVVCMFVRVVCVICGVCMCVEYVCGREWCVCMWYV